MNTLNFIKENIMRKPELPPMIDVDDKEVDLYMKNQYGINYDKVVDEKEKIQIGFWVQTATNSDDEAIKVINKIEHVIDKKFI